MPRTVIKKKLPSLLWEILVPCEQAGVLVPLAHHRDWDCRVRTISGGLTIMHASRGQWMNPDTGKLVAEKMIPVRFVATRRQFTKIVDFTLHHYRQHTVFAYKLSDEFVFRRGKS